MAVKITNWSLTPGNYPHDINPLLPEEVKVNIAKAYGVNMNIEISFTGEINDKTLPEKILKAIEEIIEKENAKDDE
ncbi:hypothetical protein [Bacillus swezeyi]|uniref:hypothetical protein n=1 Tax=Bacillus swezeyi TaxID=1925020 RepID=UPI0027DE790B|nr:hypothetical protein [Bacillus swezeyi]